MSLTTASVPILTTANISNITSYSASSGGNITSNGGAEVYASGVCWSTSQTPTISDNKTNDGDEIGTFTSEITSLAQNTTYYVRAYAKNTYGTGYGNTISFTTSSLPKLTTIDISNITTSSVNTGGIITSDGGAEVTDRGVCWSIYSTPTISDNKTNNGSGIGTFTSEITGLDQSTIYYVRAYAKTSNGVGYGNIISFITTSPPILTTSNISNITTFTANSGGIITSDGGYAVSARGVCWSTSQTPTISNNHTIDGDGVGTFTSEITGLISNTTYYVRAYAINSIGVGYGNTVSFTTAPETGTLTDIDGNVYSTVKIGDQ